jgi:hypothetical protein
MCGWILSKDQLLKCSTRAFYKYLYLKCTVLAPLRNAFTRHTARYRMHSTCHSIYLYVSTT